MSRRSVILAVDCSTTASKAVAFDLDGRALAESRQYLTTNQPRTGWFEQDATQWWETCADALAAVLEMLPHVSPLAICVTHQRESFVCLDRDGLPIRPGILWIDGRATEEVVALGSAWVHRLTGKPPSPVPSFYKLAWLRHHEPETLTRTTTVLDVHGFLVSRLTGRRASSWASADSTGLVALATKDWEPRLLAAAGLDRAQLPDLVAPGEVIGQVTHDAARRTGVPRGTPVISGAGDGQCAGLGTGAGATGTYYLNAGTSLSLGLHHHDAVWGTGYRTLTSPVGLAYDLETLVPAAGLALSWFRDEVCGGSLSTEELASRAQEAPIGAGGLLYVPDRGAHSASGGPGPSHGTFVGLESEHGPGEQYRAILEGLAFEQLLLLDALPRDRPVLDHLSATGGVLRLELFTRVLANVLSASITVTREREGTALGAAMIAAASPALGIFPSLDEAAARMSRPGPTVQPNSGEVAQYAQAFEAYRAERLRDL